MTLLTSLDNKEVLLECIKYTRDKIDGAILSQKPFDHYVIKHFLHPLMFERFCNYENFAHNFAKKVSHGGNRTSINILNHNYSSFVSEKEDTLLFDFFKSMEFQVQIIDFMRPHIKRPWLKWDILECVPEASYIKDNANFSLRPHTDTTQKLVTCLIYGKVHNSHSDLGTTLFSPIADWSKKEKERIDLLKSDRHPFEKFEAVKTIAYEPNTALLFSPSSDSFHGVLPGRTSNSRQVIQYQININTKRYNQKYMNTLSSTGFRDSESIEKQKKILRRRSIDYRVNAPKIGIPAGDKIIEFMAPNEVCATRVMEIFTKEPETIKWINDFNSGDIFYDLGAHIGIYTLWAAVAKNIRVFCFEPEAHNFAVLNSNIQINKLTKQCHPFCIGISDKVGITYLQPAHARPVTGQSGHQIRSDKIFDADAIISGDGQGAITDTLDNLVNHHKLPFPTHIKIDVDGIEPAIVRGGQCILQSENVETLMVEVDLKDMKHLKMITNIIDLGFSFDEKLARNTANKHQGVTYTSNILFKRNKTTRTKKSCA